jgi:hypothetical protein
MRNAAISRFGFVLGLLSPCEPEFQSFADHFRTSVLLRLTSGVYGLQERLVDAQRNGFGHGFCHTFGGFCVSREGG